MHFSAQQFFDLTGYAHADLFSGGSVWEALTRLEAYLKTLPLGVIDAHVEPGAFLINPELISIGKGSVVEAGAYIRGPCVIGENCEVRHGSYIRGQFLAGNDCVIGHATEVKNSIFLNHAVAGHFAYIGDSILGNRVNLGAGTKCANLRLDRKEVIIRGEHFKVSTGLRKLGAIVGDGSELGCNCVTNPGTVMGKMSRLFPCINAGGIILENSIRKS